MSKLSLKILPETLRSLAFGSIGVSYMGVGTAFTESISILFVQNLTDVTLMFSFDGINDHFPLATSGFMLLDVTSNKSNESGFFIAEGTRLYVKDVGSSSSGSVYVTAFYGSDS